MKLSALEEDASSPAAATAVELDSGAGLIDEINHISREIEWKKTAAECLDLSYAILFPPDLADRIFCEFERTTVYYPSEMCKVKVFGKLHDVPRQQMAYSDPHIVYKFSGSSIPGKLWTPLLKAIKDLVEHVTGFHYNFVLINRLNKNLKYRNGSDHMGEHRDNEPDLDPAAPIASLTLGQQRDFVLRHVDCIKKRKNISRVVMCLENGSLLLMNPPTNTYWYHSLPVRKNAKGIRLNFTFRKFKT